MNIRKAVDYSAMFAALESAMEADLPQMKLYCEVGKIVCTRSEKGCGSSCRRVPERTVPGYDRLLSAQCAPEAELLAIV